MISYLLSIYLYIISPLSTAFFVGTSILMLRESYQNQLEQATGWLISLSVLNCISHVTIVVVCALPCIVIYQSLKTAYSQIPDQHWYADLWGYMWLCLWTASFSLSCYQNYCIRNRFLSSSKPRALKMKSFKRSIITLLCLYVLVQIVCYVPIFWTLIWKSKKFLILLFISSFTSFFATVVMIFSYKAPVRIIPVASSLFLRWFVWYPFIIDNPDVNFFFLLYI